MDHTRLNEKIYRLGKQLKGEISFVNGDQASGLKKFTEFYSSVNQIFFGLPVPENYLESVWEKFRDYLICLRDEIKESVGGDFSASQARPKIQLKLEKFDLFMAEFAAIIIAIKKDYLKIYVKKFDYGLYQIFIVKKDNEVASITQFDSGQGPVITISRMVPEKLYLPIIEHEIAEWEYALVHKCSTSQAHQRAGLPAGHKKAKELGVWEDFLKFEERFRSKF